MSFGPLLVDTAVFFIYDVCTPGSFVALSCLSSSVQLKKLNCKFEPTELHGRQIECYHQGFGELSQKKPIETFVNLLSFGCGCNPVIVFDKPAAPTVASWVGSPAVFGSHEVEVTLKIVLRT